MIKRMYPHVFEAQVIRGIRIKNRVTVAPMHTPKLGKEGMPNSPMYMNFIRERARSGAGVVSLGEIPVNNYAARAHPWSIDVHDGIYNARALADVREQIEEYGAIASAELFHAGPFGDEKCTRGAQLCGPVTYTRPDGVVVCGMTVEDMEKTAKEFANTAALFKVAGYRHLMIHGGSWLLAAFISAFENTRNDEYGGASLENRMRFPLMVVKKVREAVGEDFILTYKLSPMDFMMVFPDTADRAAKGLSLEESVEFINAMADYIDVVNLQYQQRSDKHARWAGLSYGLLPEAQQSYMAKRMKELGAKPLLELHHSCDDPEVMENLFAEGICDRVGIGRGTLADEFLVNKMRANKPEEIRPCIKCGHCLDPNTGRSNDTDNDKMIQFARGIVVHRFHCSVNPRVGNESLKNPEKALRTKKVCIIGAGPAGCQAALTAAEQGHQVILFEKTDRVGGQIKEYEHLWFKKRFHSYVEYLNYQVSKGVIDLRLNTTATPDLVYAERPDAVIVAIGSEPIILNLPGAHNNNVYEATDITSGRKIDELGNTIVIIGGNMVGCEVAMQLMKLYKDKKIVILEKANRILNTMMMGERLAFMDHFNWNICHAEDPLNITEPNTQLKYYANMNVIEITSEGVKAQDTKTGEEKLFPADNVVMAVGMKAKAVEAEKFSQCALDFTTIGDCAKVKDIEYAVATGYNAAMSLDNF